MAWPIGNTDSVGTSVVGVMHASKDYDLGPARAQGILNPSLLPLVCGDSRNFSQTDSLTAAGSPHPRHTLASAGSDAHCGLGPAERQAPADRRVEWARDGHD